MGSRCYECAEFNGYCSCPDPRDGRIKDLQAELAVANDAINRLHQDWCDERRGKKCDCEVGRALAAARAES